MSDSLTRLVLRAWGAPPTVEPLLPPRYAAAEPGLRERDEPLPTSPQPPSRPRAFDVAQRPLTPASAISPLAPIPLSPADDATERSNLSATVADTPARPRNVQPAMRPLERPAQLCPPGHPVDDGVPAASPAGIVKADIPLPGLRDKPAQAKAFATAAELPEVAEAAARPTAITGADPRAPSAPPGRAPTRTMRSANSAASEETAPAPPDRPEVRISIGRVEVHALPPPPQAVRQAPPRRPTVSLGDYLARRNGRAS